MRTRKPLSAGRLILAGCVVLVVIGLLAYPRTRKSEHPVDPRLASANNGFGFRLFKEILKKDAGKNTFISPSSIALALSMAYNGAAGTTKEAMAKTLGVEEMSLEEVNRANAGVMSALKNPDPKLRLSIANSLWARKGFSPKREFIRKSKDFYRAEVASLDFSDPQSVTRVNSWVRRETRGKIRNIIKRFGKSDLLLMLNAIYFKGVWAKQFDKADTREERFNLPDGNSKTHPIMHQENRVGYYQGENFEAVSLPYGKGRLSMYVFLPDKSSNLKEFLDTLNTENWKKWMSRFRKEKLKIALPRFRMEYKVLLKKALIALGMGVAFDDRANFDGICPGIWIDWVKHKSFAEVNEEGTEAAAVTGVMFLKDEGLRPFIVDRPFFFAIRDNESGAVLFMGTVVDPVAP